MKTKWSLLEKRAKITPFDIPVDYNIINIGVLKIKKKL